MSLLPTKVNASSFEELAVDVDVALRGENNHLMYVCKKSI